MGTCVSAACDIGDLTASGTYDTDVGIWFMSVGHVCQCEPLSIGTPHIRERVSPVEPCTAVRNLTDGTGFDVPHHKSGPVFYECDFFSVGREFGIRTVDVKVPEDGGFIYESGIGEVRIFLAGDFRPVELSDAVTVRGIDYGSVIMTENGIIIGGCRVRDLLGGAVFDRGDKYVSADGKSYLLAVKAYICIFGTAGAGDGLREILFVHAEIYIDFYGLLTRILGIYLPIPSIAEKVFSDAQEADRVSGEMADFRQFAGLVDLE